MSSISTLRHKIAVAQVDRPPPGFATTLRYAQKWNLSICQAGVIIRQALRAGLMEKKMFRLNVGSIVRPCACYREVKSPKPANTAKLRR